ncbi:DMT family transporter [Pseudoduganella armeniaca]|uniref:EamA family transporter n=1 Tax=Pseudoduganella armeniaca TaxID=2072590 RepID=A0A2R4CA07_9BURK|nr:DMT family transporter [Pseudoduganella armeniaca]AVR96477.1 EamA family transporter [Pseudoduganella armeniaca]
MSITLLCIVLCAAVLHASWNAVVKAGPDKLFGTVLVASSAALVALPLLCFVTPPAPASWPWLAASAGCHLLYYRLLAAAYAHGDMSHAYPLMRGAAPLFTLAASAPLLDETLTWAQYGAAGVICGGVLAMSLGHGHAGRRTTLFALGNALAIAAYTLIDGIGVRRSGSAAGYTLWLFVLSAPPLLLSMLPRRTALLAYARRHWRTGLMGSVGTVAAYGLALWAMTRAPVALVAALRETSILFATLIAAVLLRENVGRRRMAAAGLIACGAAAMRFA